MKWERVVQKLAAIAKCLFSFCPLTADANLPQETDVLNQEICTASHTTTVSLVNPHFSHSWHNEEITTLTYLATLLQG